MSQTSSTPAATGFEIEFRSLLRKSRSLTFSCDSEGRVDLDAMSERARNSYFFACATIGGEYAMPVLKASEAALDPPGGCDSGRTDASASQDHPLARCSAELVADTRTRRLGPRGRSGTGR